MVPTPDVKVDYERTSTSFYTDVDIVRLETRSDPS
jgi:hypothetical protein